MSDRMSRAEARALAKQVAEALATADALIAKYGEDLPDGSVIAFDKTFGPANISAFPPGTINPLPEPLTYSYAAIRAGGLWYTTGSKIPKGYEWEDLLDWLDEGVPVTNLQLLRRGPAIPPLTPPEHEDTHILNPVSEG